MLSTCCNLRLSKRFPVSTHSPLFSNMSLGGLIILSFLILSYAFTCSATRLTPSGVIHDDVIKWKHFPRYWPFARGIHRSPVNSPHKGQWRGALMYSLICAGINRWLNNREAGDLRRYRAYYDVAVMLQIHNNKHHSFASYKVTKIGNSNILKPQYVGLNFVDDIGERISQNSIYAVFCFHLRCSNIVFSDKTKLL